MTLKFIEQKGNKHKDFVMICFEKSEIKDAELRKIIGTVQAVLFTDTTNVKESIMKLKDINPDKIKVDKI